MSEAEVGARSVADVGAAPAPDSCPQCHKRIGQSVIAVHAPRGEATHYQCKDAFSARLQAARG